MLVLFLSLVITERVTPNHCLLHLLLCLITVSPVMTVELLQNEGALVVAAMALYTEKQMGRFYFLSVTATAVSSSGKRGIASLATRSQCGGYGMLCQGREVSGESKWTPFESLPFLSSYLAVLPQNMYQLDQPFLTTVL